MEGGRIEMLHGSSDESKACSCMRRKCFHDPANVTACWRCSTILLLCSSQRVAKVSIVCCTVCWTVEINGAENGPLLLGGSLPPKGNITY